MAAFSKLRDVGQWIDDVPRNRDELRERSVAAVVGARDAQHLAVVAQIDLAAPAEETRAARDGRVEGDAAACAQVLDVGARFTR